MANRASERVLCEQDIVSASGLPGNVVLPSCLEMIDYTHKLLCGMRNGNIIVFSFGSFLIEVSAEGWIPKTYIFCGIEQCKAKITRTTFFHSCFGRRSCPDW